MSKKSLNGVLKEQMAKVPRAFLIRGLERKIRDAGLTEDAPKIAEALASHLLSGERGDFVWDDGVESGERINLQLSSDDIADVAREVDEFIKNKLPQSIQDIVTNMSKSKLREAKKEWPEYQIWQSGQNQIFRNNIQLRWGNGLDLLRLLLNESLEIGENKLEALSRSRAKKGMRKREVTLLLHIRACQTAAEIVSLIESGYADGAMARWRTLYELRVVADIIMKFGDDAAQRYIDHQHVSRKQEMDNDLRHPVAGGRQSYSDQVQSIINQNLAEVIQEYGSDFATPYGWASHCTGMRRPTFRDLEAAIDLPELPPSYKMASYRVHAGVAGLFSGLGTLGVGALPIAGASNAGLEVPAVNTAYTLVQFTGLLFERLSKLEDQIQVMAVTQLRDEIEKEFFRAARKLIRDDDRVRNAQSKVFPQA